MADPVKVRRLSDEEGRKLQRLVRRGEGKGQASVVRYRRALIVLASAGGNTVPVIARLVQTSEDRVRDVIHNFNRVGMKALDPQWAGGRPRSISDDDVAFIVETATCRPEKLGRPLRVGVSASWSSIWPRIRRGWSRSAGNGCVRSSSVRG
jgi:transposase